MPLGLSLFHIFHHHHHNCRHNHHQHHHDHHHNHDHHHHHHHDDHLNELLPLADQPLHKSSRLRVDSHGDCEVDEEKCEQQHQNSGGDKEDTDFLIDLVCALRFYKKNMLVVQFNRIFTKILSKKCDCRRIFSIIMLMRYFAAFLLLKSRPTQIFGTKFGQFFHHMKVDILCFCPKQHKLKLRTFLDYSIAN